MSAISPPAQVRGGNGAATAKRLLFHAPTGMAEEDHPEYQRLHRPLPNASPRVIAADGEFVVAAMGMSTASACGGGRGQPPLGPDRVSLGRVKREEHRPCSEADVTEPRTTKSGVPSSPTPGPTGNGGKVNRSGHLRRPPDLGDVSYFRNGRSGATDAFSRSPAFWPSRPFIGPILKARSGSS